MKTWKVVLVAVSALILIVPLTAFATTSLFDDVDDSNIFVDDINWMKTAGITNGCDATGTLYCPEDNVTRQQMAAFMHRLATKRVVNAGTLDGYDSADFALKPTWVSNSQHFTGVAPGAQVTVDANCPVLKTILSGGGQSTYSQLLMTTSRPLDGAKWRVTWTNTGATAIDPTVTVWAMCIGAGLLVIP